MNQKHQETHPEEPFDCLGCSMKFRTYSLMMEHLEDGDCRLGATQDSICTDVQEFYTALDHRDPDTNVWPLRLNFVCYTCETTFDRMASLLEHLERRECPLRDWQRKSHVKRIFYGPLKRKVLSRIECVKCNRLFKDQAMRNKHMQEKHGQFYCFACKRDHNDMATHFREMQGPGNWHPDSEFPCNDCSRITIFKKEWQLYQHRWTVHLGCAFCGVNFENKETLSRHDNKYHRKCGICASIEPSWWDLRSVSQSHRLVIKLLTDVVVIALFCEAWHKASTATSRSFRGTRGSCGRRSSPSPRSITACIFGPGGTTIYTSYHNTKDKGKGGGKTETENTKRTNVDHELCPLSI